MSLNYSSRIIAEARITYVSGTKALGSSLLRMNVEFQQPAWEPGIGQASAAMHSAVLSLRTDSGGGELGRACPDHAMVLKSGPHSTTVHQMFSISLSDAQMFAIEQARKGGGVELVLSLIAGGHGEHGHQVINDNISYRVPLSEWARILRELGHGDIIVLGVNLPTGPDGARLRSAIELLHAANRYLVNGEYDIVVARCRQAVESVQAAIDDGEPTKEAMMLYRKDKASRESMSSLQREQVILETLRHYANLAHHVDNRGSTECYGRADATFLLALAASAVTRACARARIVSPDFGE
ncbi:hypothetical protein ACT2FY_24265 [Paraburkholderia fungorum]|uniref:hypothetical protein n=1 Tax=Paraburkholderia fungorum TaxID=134537 RepID=UPI00402BBAEC